MYVYLHVWLKGGHVRSRRDPLPSRLRGRLRRMAGTTGESAEELHSGTHEVGPIHPEVGDKHDPARQTFAKAALSQEWTTFFDLLPDKDIYLSLSIIYIYIHMCMYYIYIYIYIYITVDFLQKLLGP